MKNISIKTILPFFIFSFSFFISDVAAQWQQSNSPTGGAVTSMAGTSKNLYAGSTQGGAFHSPDDGNSWTPANDGLANKTVNSIVIIGSELYVATDQGVYRSSDDGAHWQQANNGLDNVWIAAIAVDSNANLYVGTNGGGMFTSTNGGNKWSVASNGFTDSSVTCVETGTIPDEVGGIVIFAGTYSHGVFRSFDNGNSWQSVNKGLPSVPVPINVMAVNGMDVYAGTAFGVYYSSDTGSTWTPAGLAQQYIQALAIIGTNVFAGTNSSAYRSSDSGAHWTTINTGLADSQIAAFKMDEKGNLFTGTYGDGIARSTNNGNTWTPVNNGLTNVSINAFTSGTSGNNATFFAGTTKGVYISHDSGATWQSSNSGIYPGYSINSMVSIGGVSIAGTSLGTYRSTDGGSSWVAADSGISSYYVGALAVSGRYVYAATGAGVFRSADSGKTWVFFNNGLPNTQSDIFSFGVNGKYVFAGTSNGMFVTSDDGVTWSPANVGLPDNLAIYSFAVQGDTIYVASEKGAYRSFDNGAHWALAGLANFSLSSIIVSGGNLLASGYDVVADTLISVKFSSDYGATWSDVGLMGDNVNKLFVNNGNVFAGTIGDGIWRRPISDFAFIAVHEPPAPAQLALSQNYPNPFSTETEITYTLPRAMTISLKIYNALGEEVAMPVHGSQSAGAHTAAFNAGDLPAGVYFYRLAAGKGMRTGTMMVVR